MSRHFKKTNRKDICHSQQWRKAYFNQKEKHTSTPLNITSLKFITVHFYHMVPIQKKKIIT